MKQEGAASPAAFRPVIRQNLTDRLALRIRAMIQDGAYREGDRLPPIMEMARRFGVGHPSLREALRKLEAMGVVEIRHGSGVYVARSQDVLLLAAPGYTGRVTNQLLLDLIQARTPLELLAAQLAARCARDEDLGEMRRLLESAGQHLDDEQTLNAVNMAFHARIAAASGNTVLAQLVGVLHELFGDEQRLIIGIYGSPVQDHDEHLAILAALEARDEQLAVERMRRHLSGVEAAISQWRPEPVSAG